MRVANAFGGELVEVWCLGIGVAIAAHHRGDVFEGDVEDVGAVGCGGGAGAEQGEYRK